MSSSPESSAYPDDSYYYDPEIDPNAPVEINTLEAYFTNPDLHFLVRFVGVLVLFAQSFTFLTMLFAELWEYNYWNTPDRNSMKIWVKLKEEEVKEEVEEDEKEVEMTPEPQNPTIPETSQHQQPLSSILLDDTEIQAIKRSLQYFQNMDRKRLRKEQKFIELNYTTDLEIMKKPDGADDENKQAELRRKQENERIRKENLALEKKKRKEREEEEWKRKMALFKQREGVVDDPDAKKTRKPSKSKAVGMRNPETKKKPSAENVEVTQKTPPLNIGSTDGPAEKKMSKEEQKTQTVSLDDNKEMTTVKEPKIKEKTISPQKTQDSVEEAPTQKDKPSAAPKKKPAQPPKDFHEKALRELAKELSDKQMDEFLENRKKRKKERKEREKKLEEERKRNKK